MDKHSRGLITRRKLFDSINRKLRLLDSSIGETIMCPLCGRHFGVEALESNLLTIEDIPPTSAARLINERRRRTLTCKDCNNTMGSTYQNDLKRFLIGQLHMAGKYDGPLPGDISVGDSAPLRVNITWLPGKISVAGVPKANNPAITKQHVDMMNKIVDTRQTNWTSSLTINAGYRLNVAWAAYILAGYLTAYVLTDGHYAFSRAGKKLQNLFRNGKLDNMGASLIVPDEIGLGGRTWIAEVVAPKRLRCFWAKVAGNIVVLPQFDDEGMSCYDEWSRVSDSVHFGLKPQNVSLEFRFLSAEDMKEAKKCLPARFKD